MTALEVRPRPAHEHAILAGLYGTRDHFAQVLEVALEECARDFDTRRADPQQLGASRIAVLEELDPASRADRLGPYYGFVGAATDPNDPRRAPLFVTTVERLAACPWQTLLTRLLRVQPVPDPLGALPGFSPPLVGALVHEVLEQIVGDPRGERGVERTR